jgi:hypothetical protein
VGAKLMVDADSGFLVHPADHQQLQIVFLPEQPQLGIEMGKNASIYVQQHFDIEKIVVENIQFYKSI